MRAEPARRRGARAKSGATRKRAGEPAFLDSVSPSSSRSLRARRTCLAVATLSLLLAIALAVGWKGLLCELGTSILGARSAQPAPAVGREHPSRAGASLLEVRARAPWPTTAVRSGVACASPCAPSWDASRPRRSAAGRGRCCSGGDGRDRGRLSRGRAGGGRLGLLRLRQPGAPLGRRQAARRASFDRRGVAGVAPARAGASRLPPLGRWSEPRAGLPSRPADDDGIVRAARRAPGGVLGGASPRGRRGREPRRTGYVLAKSRGRGAELPLPWCCWRRARRFCSSSPALR